MTAIERDFPRNTGVMQPTHLLAIIATLGVLFQIGHFAEHAVQFGMWGAGYRSVPWMSPVATELTRILGGFFLPMPEICADRDAFMARQMMMGMEILHLIGNGIFLVTIASLYYFIPVKWVRWAFYVQAFHLYEHIMLTLTVLFVGTPIGLSTLFGGNTFVWSKEGVVGYRVFWHFAMNLAPSSLIMFAFRQKWQRNTNSVAIWVKTRMLRRNQGLPLLPNSGLLSSKSASAP
jgi:hypothetical protein